MFVKRDDDMSMIIQESMSIQKKLEILSDAAKYDVACTSSGVDRKGTSGGMGNSVACGICHSFSADGRCISLLKILFTNECVFDCKYCLNRSSNDVVRASFTPDEVCTLTMEFYRRNYIEGLFLSSGVLKSPNYTMELICQTLRLLREVHHFNGYIHCKAVPGADSSLIEMTGWYADRMSVNLELPTAEGLKTLAPHKNRKTILNPMKQIQVGRMNLNEKPLFNRLNQQTSNIILPQNYTDSSVNSMSSYNSNLLSKDVDNSNTLTLSSENKSNYEYNVSSNSSLSLNESSSTSYGLVKRPSVNRGFVPAGQSTQMIIGATPESDYQIISVTEALYNKFDLKRVFYSAFIRVNEDSSLPMVPGGPPLLREHRLYQADWLLRFYGFQASELLSEERPNFNVLLDPKCNWALGHLDVFPIEINKADYYTLLRVPGIGVKSAQRIVKARKTGILRFEDLKKIGVVLKRAIYFITCNGQMMYPVKIEENYITNQLVSIKERLPFGIDGSATYQQISLFDDVRFQPQNQQSFISGF
jgi:putative DNA modification/repair radical SAM protein